MSNKLEKIALELLDKYKESEELLIIEYGDDTDKEHDKLCLEFESYKKKIAKASLKCQK